MSQGDRDSAKDRDNVARKNVARCPGPTAPPLWLHPRRPPGPSRHALEQRRALLSVLRRGQQSPSILGQMSVLPLCQYYHACCKSGIPEGHLECSDGIPCCMYAGRVSVAFRRLTWCRVPPPSAPHHGTIRRKLHRLPLAARPRKIPTLQSSHQNLRDGFSRSSRIVIFHCHPSRHLLRCPSHLFFLCSSKGKKLRSTKKEAQGALLFPSGAELDEQTLGHRFELLQLPSNCSVPPPSPPSASVRNRVKRFARCSVARISHDFSEQRRTSTTTPGRLNIIGQAHDKISVR